MTSISHNDAGLVSRPVKEEINGFALLREAFSIRRGLTPLLFVVLLLAYISRASSAAIPP